MEAISAMAVSLFTNIGTAAGASAASAATVGVGITSAVVGGIGQISALNYQTALSSRAAKIQQENAERIRIAGHQDAQQQDFEVAAILGNEIAQQGASGLETTSPSFIRRRAKQRSLAAQDRERIVEDAEVQAKGEDERSLSSILEAKQSHRAKFFSLFSTGLGVSDTLITGANLNSTVASRRITNSSRTVR